MVWCRVVAVVVVLCGVCGGSGRGVVWCRVVVVVVVRCGAGVWWQWQGCDVVQGGTRVDGGSPMFVMLVNRCVSDVRHVVKSYLFEAWL